MDNESFLKRHSVLIYLVLAFGIAWGGILFVVRDTTFPATSNEIARVVPFVFLAMLAGPSIAGVLMAWRVDGKLGLRDLAARLLRWRVDARWYAALLITPLLLIGILTVLSTVSPAFLPKIVTANDKSAVLTVALAVGLMAGFFEELGWTGFAIPKLQLKHSALATALLFGPIWMLWHLLADFWGGYESFGTLYFAHVLLWLVALVAYRVLIVWVYNNTSSLMLAMLMHASFTGGQALLEPTFNSAADNIVWYSVFAAMLVLVAVVAVLTAGAKRLVRVPTPILA